MCARGRRGGEKADESRRSDENIMYRNINRVMKPAVSLSLHTSRVKKKMQSNGHGEQQCKGRGS